MILPASAGQLFSSSLGGNDRKKHKHKHKFGGVFIWYT